MSLPDDWVIKNRACDSAGGCLDGPEGLELALFLLLGTQLRLWSAVGLLADFRLQIIRVVSAPSHQEHTENK